MAVRRMQVKGAALDRNDEDSGVTVETVASLVRLAGLRVESELLAGLRDELVALRRAVAEIDDAARSAAAPGIVPFDATWREEVR